MKDENWVSSVIRILFACLDVLFHSLTTARDMNKTMKMAKQVTIYRRKRKDTADMRTSNRISFAAAVAVGLFSVASTAFQPPTKIASDSNPFLSCADTVETRLFESLEDAVVELPTTKTENTEIANIKSNLFQLAERTKRGFNASADDKRKAKELAESLQRLGSVPDPASSYYDPSATSSVTAGAIESKGPSSTISGKWTLIYTDAPDITGLDTSRNPFSTAKLGRIGQECNPPYIKNVIEWLRPDWAKPLPFSGSDDSRILQKVVTTGSATPAKPTFVELKVAGLELEAGANEVTTNDNNDNSGNDKNNLVENIQSSGLPAGILSANPIDLKGPLNPPFGRFEILYLDDELRAIRTSQNFLAVNRRIASKEDEWF